MPKKTRADTTTTTIRLDTKLRKLLETIAARELRSLSQQMTVFLKSAAEDYVAQCRLAYYEDIDEWCTPEDHRDYLQFKDMDVPDLNKPV